MDKNIAAVLVRAGTTVTVPPQMGCGAPGQLEGTPGEVLCEVAGRICYDSLGKGRNSADYHKHIQEVGHLSVYEHATMTVRMGGVNALSLVFLNRPGVWVRPVDGGKMNVTFNPRVVLDWQVFKSFREDDFHVHETLRTAAHSAWPAIVGKPGFDVNVPWEHAAPETDEEKWVSLYLAGDRGFSHEQVRHGDFSAISQRSTRYVSEDESPWVEHPLTTEYMKDLEAASAHEAAGLRMQVSDLKHLACEIYSDRVSRLQKWLVERGVDKGTARKQARGAARGYLGNALATEMIFSANVAQWKRMLRMRATVHADAEIRRVFVLALGELKKSAYGDCFARFSVAPSPDGLGEIAVESGEAAP
jgi:thymidylate synthase ThyX